MNTVVTKNVCGNLELTENNEILNSVLNSLARNNTFCPNIEKCYLQKNVDRKVFDRKEKKNIKVKRDVLKVSFVDGSWVEIARNPEDSDDIISAILYAIAKRMFGTYTEGGYVSGDGFMRKLKNIAENVVTPESELKEKNDRIKAKEAADKFEHEEAVKRRERNPSIGLRLRNLEDKFDKLLDTLNATNKKKGLFNFKK